MKTKVYITKITKALSSRNDVGWKIYPLEYHAGTFDFMKIQSKIITPKDKIILITSGIHGEEVAGPLSLLKYLDKIIDLIHSHGYKVIIYPLTNPSGFEGGTRYNIDNDEGPYGNNDFVRYQMADGTFADDDKEGEQFTQRYRSSDPQLHQQLPIETILFHKLLKADPLHQVVAHLDLHQDYITQISGSHAYFYTFSDDYQPIITEIRKHINILANTMISAGQTGGAPSDDNACIKRHDGTINDLFYRLGIHNTVAIETTGNTPLELAEKINRLRIKGMVLLLNQKTPGGSKKPSSSKHEEKRKRT